MSPEQDPLRAQVERDGYAITGPLLGGATVNGLIEAFEAAATGHKRHALRNLFHEVPAVVDLLRAAPIRQLVTRCLGPEACAVRAIFFDKTADANWKVAWHQDRTIAVRERRTVPGFGPWSVKAGVIDVEPPVDVLAQMVTLRVHLDETDKSNGPLRVIPGSHRWGRLDADVIAERRRAVGEVVCCVPRGGVMVMKPLLLHASAPATTPRHRRVVHLEFAAFPLPGGLAWRDQIALA